MTKRLNQAGNALPFIAIIIVIAILGVLGYIAWQKFFNADNPNSVANQEAVKVEAEKQEVTTYTNAAIGITFEHPKSWVSLTCAGNPNVVYFGSDIRGIGNGNQTLLCGGGSDFPPQMSIAVEDTFYDTAVNSRPVTINGVEATKSVTVETEDSIYPAGFEVTKYVVPIKGKTVVFTYSKWPATEADSYDTSPETREQFKRLIETTLKSI